MTDWIGDMFTSDVGWRHLEALVDVGDRMAGSPGERDAAESTRDALGAYARDARLETFEIQGWRRGESAIRTAAGEEDCIALPRSPSASVAGDLVDLGHGLPADVTEADVAGNVALCRAGAPDWFDREIHRREKYYRAVDAGASGFVYWSEREGGLPETGSVGNAESAIGPVPAVAVSAEVGARLARRHEGEPIEVVVDAAVSEVTSQNVHADLGPDTDETVLLTAHVDAHDVGEGAMDNAAGTAMTVELARVLAARADELDTRVHVLVFGAEEVGLLGSAHDAAARDLEDVRAVLNLDGVGRGRTLTCYTHGFDALETAARAVGSRFDHPITVTPEQSPHSDHWSYVHQGVPGYHVTSGGEGRGWGHTAADTLDKLEPRTFREQAILLADLAVELADDGFAVAHASRADVAAALEEEGLAAGMKVTGDWPY